MHSEAELRIVITPSAVDKVQLLATDADGEIIGVELYRKLIREIQHFTLRANQILQSVPSVKDTSLDNAGTYGKF